MCRRAAVLAAERTGVVVTPSVPTGLSEPHMAFGGTLTPLCPPCTRCCVTSAAP
ncbi:hypothetical protein ABT167_38005 [Streptomyces sp. NPDC001792]|uniref:hypothetical protein n=1 Tax=Streptomyces sp. NPDC001792 TaxID=3154524 RepID=UPI003331C80A